MSNKKTDGGHPIWVSDHSVTKINGMFFALVRHGRIWSSRKLLFISYWKKNVIIIRKIYYRKDLRFIQILCKKWLGIMGPFLSKYFQHLTK